MGILKIKLSYYNDPGCHGNKIRDKTAIGLYSMRCSKTANVNVKKTYQFKTHCKDDVMISLHKNSKKSFG